MNKLYSTRIRKYNKTFRFQPLYYWPDHLIRLLDSFPLHFEGRRQPPLQSALRQIYRCAGLCARRPSGHRPEGILSPTRLAQVSHDQVSDKGQG